MHIDIPSQLSPRISLFASTIDTGNIDSFVERIISLGKARQSSYTCCVNVHMLVESRRDPALSQALRMSDLNTPDGMPVAYCMQSFHKVQQKRVAGMDLFPRLLAEAEKQAIRVFFFGDTEEVLANLIQQAQESYPSLEIAGSYSPPFRNITVAEEAKMISKINEARPHLVFVALGCPKQEKWMLRQKGIVQGSMIGVGNAFRTFLGFEKRAPKWMQRLSLEWLYRLAQNPKRLWRRYFFSNSIFLFMVVSQMLGIKKGNKHIDKAI